MELISQIINDLIDDEKSLNAALLKTKVLASRIQNQDLLEWINNEISGYKSVANLPEYRKHIYNEIKGSYINGNMKYTNTQIPTAGLDSEFENNLRTTDFLDSITSLERLLSSEKSSTLISPIRAEITALIGENWRDMGNPYLQIITAHKMVSKTSIVEIITSVRNKLLDFMLELDGKYGELTEIKELKLKKEEISSIVNNTIIHGDGNVLNTGKKASINNKVKITKLDKDELTSYLKSVGLNSGETTEIAEIIDTETPNYENETFGIKVNTWIAKMINKTIDGTWNVSIGAAGTILAEGIKKYYGM